MSVFNYIPYLLYTCIARNLPPGKHVFLQSDIEELQSYMVECFDARADVFAPAMGYHSIASALSLNTNPTTVQTEREVATIAKNQSVFRMMYVRR